MFARQEQVQSRRYSIKEKELNGLFVRRLAKKERTHSAQQQKDLLHVLRVTALENCIRQREQEFDLNKSRVEQEKTCDWLERSQINSTKHLRVAERKGEINFEAQQKLAYLEALTKERIQQVLQSKAQLEQTKKESLDMRGRLQDNMIRDRQLVSRSMQVCIVLLRNRRKTRSGDIGRGKTATYLRTTSNDENLCTSTRCHSTNWLTS